MNTEELRAAWKREEAVAHIRGWDFSHIHGRYGEEEDLPWDYESIVRSYLRDDRRILDYDTGGGEFLLKLGHPYHMTSATEGYPPNVELCRGKLLPLGIDFRENDDPSALPFEDNTFDIVLNRHGSYDPAETRRVLKEDGLFITQQVGGDNDRDLVKMVLPDTPEPFPGHNMRTQRQAFIDAGFDVIMSDEAYRPIVFYDVGAFVWFARIIEWEFPDFSVDRCFDRLLEMQAVIEKTGKITGTIHRFLLVAKKV